jgi:rare lipoprotein A
VQFYLMALTSRLALTASVLACTPLLAHAEDDWFQKQFKPPIADAAPVARARPRISAPVPVPVATSAPNATQPVSSGADLYAVPAPVPTSPSVSKPLSVARSTIRPWRTIVYPARALDAGMRTASLGTSAGFPAHDIMAKPLTGYAHQLSGIASYYWQDQMTSSGERFDRRALTAAHKTLPLGTRVRVTNITNGKSTVVRINDRGPFKGGRIIDLSEAAAQQVDMTGPGLARVAIEVVR